MQMAELEGERQAALQQAAESKAEAAQLAEARQRLVWQSRLLEKMSEVGQVVGSFVGRGACVAGGS